MTAKGPLVSVVTPVHNGEAYLAECLASVPAQTYRNWEYLVVDNASTDGTRDLARKYAAADPRVRFEAYDEFVDVIPSHNRALRLISAESKYCKVVSADDWLFPECLERMVEAAEAHPSAGFVGAYQLSGGGDRWEVRWAGLPAGCALVPGREICRTTLLSGPYVFGTPTSTLYRSDLVRARRDFYPSELPYADVSAYFEYLRGTDFAFVHQVLSFERVHPESLSAGHKRISTQHLDALRNFLEYGKIYLTASEYEARLEDLLGAYYRLLAAGLLNMRDREFWKHHREALAGLGYPFYGRRLAKAVGAKLLDLALNPKQTLEKALKRI